MTYDQGNEANVSVESTEPVSADEIISLVPIPEYVNELVARARRAVRPLATLSTAAKDRALLAMATALEEQKDRVLAANTLDLEAFGSMPATVAMTDRLRLTDERIFEMAAGLRAVAALPDPLGDMPKMWTRPNGMQVGRVRVPIGVIGIIYESRPNVTADSIGLCLKSGNVSVLRGGSEAIHSNTAIALILSKAAEMAGMPAGVINFVARLERELISLLLKQDAYIDLIIPRGGESLMQVVTEHATIPVIKHNAGICHVYVDADADLAMAERVCLNAKVQRPSTCNAMETLLVHQSVARVWLAIFIDKLVEAKVEVRGCDKTCLLSSSAKLASPDDFGKEFLDLIVAIKVVKNFDEALEHIAKYGSRHTEAIVTSNYPKAMRFLREVDASAVLVNASTRLNDGYQFGLGAEIGISTSRIHARGPMGLEELTCFKFIVFGSGQVRE